ncbi:MAG: HesA/MoeB/ThiF family protein [Candidatus Thermoplasmatota archaeon]
MDRHDRQTRLDGIGVSGQARIREGRVLVVGVGGLGCPAAMYLAGAGVGHLTLVDPDLIAPSNLHRQILFTSADVDKPKAEVARRRLLALDASLDIDVKPVALDARNAAELVAGHDVVLDCTDDLGAKLALARACAQAGIPLVHGAAAGWEGIVAVFDPPRTPCYFCAFPNPAPGASCSDVGVLGPLVGQLGALQAQEAIKLLAGLGSSLAGSLHLVDARSGLARTITLKKRAGCECTMEKPTYDLPAEGTPVACPLPWAAPEVPVVLAQALTGHESEVFLLDVREPDEHEEQAIPGSHLIPLGSLQRRVAEVPKDRQVVVYCAVGGRSARATEFLRRNGVEAVNLHGGIRAWLQLQD